MARVSGAGGVQRRAVLALPLTLWLASTTAPSARAADVTYVNGPEGLQYAVVVVGDGA
jgi:hypothetical protein